MLSKIVSFGYKFRNPSRDLPFDPVVRVVLDVRDGMPNPYRVQELRGLTGVDHPVVVWLSRQPRTEVFYRSLERRVRKLMEDQGETELYLGCFGGQHRSVYLAERLAGQFGVPVEHLDKGKE